MSEEKRVKITLSDTGAQGEILVDGKPLHGVTSVCVSVGGIGPTKVTFTMPASHCDITYDASELASPEEIEELP